MAFEITSLFYNLSRFCSFTAGRRQDNGNNWAQGQMPFRRDVYCKISWFHRDYNLQLRILCFFYGVKDVMKYYFNMQKYASCKAYKVLRISLMISWSRWKDNNEKIRFFFHFYGDSFRSCWTYGRPCYAFRKSWTKTHSKGSGHGAGTCSNRSVPFHWSKLHAAPFPGRCEYAVSGLAHGIGTFPIRVPCSPSPAHCLQ